MKTQTARGIATTATIRGGNVKSCMFTKNPSETKRRRVSIPMGTPPIPGQCCICNDNQQVSRTNTQKGKCIPPSTSVCSRTTLCGSITHKPPTKHSLCTNTILILQNYDWNKKHSLQRSFTKHIIVWEKIKKNYVVIHFSIYDFFSTLNYTSFISDFLFTICSSMVTKLHICTNSFQN